MKPRNKKEEYIFALHQQMAPISEKQLAWARAHCFYLIAEVCKGEAWCTDCSKSWVLTGADKDAKTVVCPYCGRKLNVVKSRRIKTSDERYLTIAQKVKEYQVLRHVYVARHTRKDGYNTFVSQEVCQQWFDAKGNMKVIAKSLNMQGSDFRWDSDMSFKDRNGSYYYGMEIYNIHGIAYPRGTFIPILHKYGLKTSLHGMCAGQLIKALLNGNNYIESLFKRGQYSLAQYVLDRGLFKYKWVVNICSRNNYIIKDASMYDDYIHLLEYFHLDTHNAHYVCPKNLKKAHDKLLEKKKKIDAVRDEQRRREEAKRKRERDIELLKKRKKEILRFYQRMKEAIFNIVISGDGIDIRPLQSVTQFYQEGKKMHHCVYNNRYFAHDNCLILSAKKDGKRLETVEVNLQSFKIIQSRAACNKQSEYHDRIINLVNKNMNLIRKAV